MWNRLQAHYAAQIAEIGGDRRLQWYGAALALTLFPTYFYWRRTLAGVVGNLAMPLCWPFTPACHAHPLRLLPVWGAQAYWALALALAGAAVVYFWRGQVRAGWWALALAQLLKGFWLTLDYQFMGNYHYMPFLVCFTFLFLPMKRASCQLLIVLFYLFAGFLKLNPEWLTGSALNKELELFGHFGARAALFYVVVLELVISLGLLSARRAVKAASLAQFAVFHAFSFTIVGYFYPLVMGCLLAIFAFDLLPRPHPQPSPATRFGRANLAFVLTFLLAQLLPLLSGEDPALFTHRRISALNMFDANVQCESGIYVRRSNEVRELIPDFPDRYALRVKCDPILFESAARNLCRELKHDPELRGVDLALSARRSTDREFTPVLRAVDFCGGRTP